ncbi:MAG TPA: dihydropteroate synthase, partial [Chloroflexota bacterium]|nr:dihydropteroate synthase [Chloroflexota bacterium]
TRPLDDAFAVTPGQGPGWGRSRAAARALGSLEGSLDGPDAPAGAGLLGDLRGLGVGADEALELARHGTGRALRLEGLWPAVGLELRERLRALGGAAAVGPSAYAGAGAPDGGTPLDAVDVVLLGSVAQLEALAERLDVAAVEGPSMSLAGAIRRALAGATWRPRTLHLGPHRLDLSRRVAVMGIVNVTPDSFFDGGRHYDPQQAVEHALRLVAEGADLLDVGGDSAGGRAAPIDAAEEIRRVQPVLRALARETRVPLAVDTYRARTAAAALDAGATMVNDITGLGDPEMAGVVAGGDAGLSLMHIKGRPKEFPPDFDYRSLVGDVARFLEQRTERALAAGIGAERLVVDPGIEFGKLLYQDLELLRRLPELGVLGYPVLVAVSRKHFIGNVLGLPPDELLEGTAAAVAFSVFRGAHLVRVHDVRAMVRVTRMAEALVGLRGGDEAAGRRRSDGTVV